MQGDWGERNRKGFQEWLCGGPVLEAPPHAPRTLAVTGVSRSRWAVRSCFVRHTCRWRVGLASFAHEALRWRVGLASFAHEALRWRVGLAFFAQETRSWRVGLAFFGAGDGSVAH
jgi:hypothetical protein